MAGTATKPRRNPRRVPRPISSPTVPLEPNPPLEPQPIFVPPDHYFKDMSCKEKYVHRGLCKLVVEKTVAPNIDNTFQIRAFFDHLGWSPILHLPTHFYPYLVRVFFANIEDSRKEITEIRTSIKDIPIVVSRASLTRLFQFSDEGPSIVFGTEVVHTDSSYNLMETIRRLGLKVKRRPNTSKLLISAGPLTLVRRLLHCIINFNVSPRAGNPSDIRNSDVYLLSRLIFGVDSVPVPLPGLIIKEILDAARAGNPLKALCFPRLISRIIEDANVPIDSLDFLEATSNSDILGNASLGSLGYELTPTGNWQPKTSSAPPLVAPSITSENRSPSTSQAAPLVLPTFSESKSTDSTMHLVYSLLSQVHQQMSEVHQRVHQLSDRLAHQEQMLTHLYQHTFPGGRPNVLPPPDTTLKGDDELGGRGSHGAEEP